MADFLEAGKIPEVWKIAALLWFDRLDGAVVALQKNAATIRFFLQGQSAAIPAQPRELLDEIRFSDALKDGEPGDLFILQFNLPRPAAAGRAALTFIKNRHARRLSFRQPFVNHRDACIIAALLGVRARDVRRGDDREILFWREPHHDIPHGVRAAMPQRVSPRPATF